MDANFTIHVIRLKPHEDLKCSLLDFARKNNIKAGIILTCVGSLEQYALRFANAKVITTVSGFFEIVSLVGTFSTSSSHLHIALCDSTGQTVGGHLVEGSRIYTTAEIAIANLTNITFERVLDPTYGYHELFVSPNKN